MKKLLLTAFLLSSIAAFTQDTIGPKWAITWDHADPTDSFIIGTKRIGDQNILRTAIVEAGEEKKAMLSDILISPQNNSEYEIYIKAVDPAGNESNWSTPAGPLKWDDIPPTDPINVNLRLELNISITQ